MGWKLKSTDRVERQRERGREGEREGGGLNKGMDG